MTYLPNASDPQAQSWATHPRVARPAATSIPASSEMDAGACSSPPPSVEDGPLEEWWAYLFVGAILTWSLVSFLLEGYWSWHLARHGVAGTAKVLSYQPERVTHRSGRGSPRRTFLFHMHQVSFLDRVETVKLNRKYSVGAEVSVLYVPDMDGIATAANRGDSAFTIFLSRIHGRKFLWLLLWIKLIVAAVLGWLSHEQVSEGAASAILDAAVHPACGVHSE